MQHYVNLKVQIYSKQLHLCTYMQIVTYTVIHFSEIKNLSEKDRDEKKMSLKKLQSDKNEAFNV